MSKRGWVYEDDGLVVYRASSLGSCVRSLTAARLGEDASPPAPSLRAAMEASGSLEDEVLRRAGVEMADGGFIWQQRKVDLVVPGDKVETAASTPSGNAAGPSGAIIVRGHIDALHQQSDTIVEVKVFGDDNWNKWTSGANTQDSLDNLGTLGWKYRVQAAVYGHATGRRVRFIVAHKVGRLIGTPTNEREWSIDEVDIGPPLDPSSLYTLDAIRDRIAFIEDHASQDLLPDCDQSCTEWDDVFGCHIFERVKGDETDELLIDRYIELRELLGSVGEKDGTKRWGLLGEYEDIKDHFKKAYGLSSGTNKLDIGGVRVSVVWSDGREYVDGRALKKERPDVYEEYVRPGKGYHSLIVGKKTGERDA